MTITLKTVGCDGASGVSLSLLSLVNQVNPIGHQVFTTTLADSQGALVVHFNGGQTAVHSGLLAVGDAVAPVENNVMRTLYTSHLPLPTAHFSFEPPPAAHYFEQVFADADGMTSEDNAVMPQQEPSYLPADDWAQLLSGMGIDQRVSQASEIAFAGGAGERSRLVGGIYFDDDPDMDLPK